MTRYRKLIHAALLFTFAWTTPAGMAAAEYLNPVPEVAVKFCTGEGTPNTNHYPQMTDGCRNGAKGSNIWTTSLTPPSGSMIQVDLFLKIRREFLSTYALSVRYDKEGKDVLDYVAMSYYNLRQFYPDRPLTCAPLGDPNENDGGCEELTGTSLVPTLYYPEDRDGGTGELISRDIVTVNPDIGPAPIFDSTGTKPGWIYQIFALGLSDGVRGTANALGGPVEVRIGSIWFRVNEGDGEKSTIRAGLFNRGVDILMDKNNEYIGLPVGNPPPGWVNPETVLTWSSATATVPEPGLVAAQFAILATLGWVSLKRRRR